MWSLESQQWINQNAAWLARVGGTEKSCLKFAGITVHSEPPCPLCNKWHQWPGPHTTEEIVAHFTKTTR